MCEREELKGCKNCYSYDRESEVCVHEDTEQEVLVNYKKVYVPFTPPDDEFCCCRWR